MSLRTDLIDKALSLRDASIKSVEPPVPEIQAADLPVNSAQAIGRYLTEDEVAITSLDAEDLLAKIRAKTLTCEAVTRAFLRRAAVAQKLTNCVTELLPATAIARAKYLDSLPAPLGPLHGLPLSVKEHIGHTGSRTHASVVCFIDDPPTEGRVSVSAALEEAGAVIFARTTQPQSIMHLETSSVIYGRTVNAHHRDLTSGGSSGGEGSLIGLRGSVLGVGSDIGGSIRNPAGNNGIYGFKPTAKRIGGSGAKRVFGGQEGVLGTQGPLSTSRAGLELFMSTYLASQPWVLEDFLFPVPWRTVSLPPKLKIAVLWSDGVVNPHPPVQRALREVAASMTQAGIEVVDWVPLAHDECWEITHALYFEDGGKNMRQALAKGGEEVLPLTEWVLASGDGHVRERTAEEVCGLKVRRDNYKARYRAHWLATGQDDGHPVDAILCPVGPGPAPPHECAKYWCYTSQWNLLDYPAAVFPVTTVDKAVDVYKSGEPYQPLGPDDAFNHSLYDPDKYHGVPTSLQVVAPRFEDEKCLAILAAIEKAMGRA